jgi:type IV pilus assembly protein PilY1
VDGPISVGDVNFGGSTSDWHTILVGGFGRGAKGYYAMDITDPQNPKYLWEFSDTNLGYSYGNPSINKLPNGDWAVFVSSGYNNADGKGYLYALNPKTGAIKSGFPLSTGSGTATSPSNLGKLSSYITDLQSDNTADYMYAGDLNGDLWRFDLNPSATGHSGVAVLKLAHLQNAAGTAQPITTRPELSLVSGIRVVYVGTGEYLGDPDLQDTSTQSFYAIKDTLGAANLGGSTQATWNPRTDTGTVGGSTVPLFAQRKLISKANDGSQILAPDGSIARKICSGTSSQISSTTGNCINESGASVNFTDYGGWFVDFPESGERMNVDMNLTLGTLTIGSNIPASSACTTGGSSFLNYIDFRTGLSVAGASGIASKYLANALIVGINVIQLPDGTIGAIVTTSDDQHITIPPPVETDKFQGKRNSWRELDLY